MASITQYKGRWRAHVYVRGVRASKLFPTRRQAHAWAVERESELAKGGTGQTFSEAAERWLALKLPQLTPANAETVGQSIRTHVLPVIGGKSLRDLTRADLVGVVRGIAAAGHVETAHRVGQRIRAILDHAIDHGDIQSHPGAGLSRVLPAKSKTPMPAVTPDELPELLRAIHGYPEPVTRIGLLLLAHTFVRTSELIGARWEEIKGDVWVIPEERMKRRIPHVVPLSTHVRALLDSLRQLTGEESAYLLASRINPMVGISNNTLLFALYRLGYRGRMTGHGFRAIASSVLNESGQFSRDAIERQLAHRETDAVRAAYHRATYLPERIKMMHWWGDYLARCSSTHS
jgi:integrase